MLLDLETCLQGLEPSQARLPSPLASQEYPAQEHAKDHPVVVEHAPGHSLVAALKEGGGDDVQTLLVVLDTAQLTRAVHQDGVEDVQEELEGVLVEEVDLVEVVDGEVDTR